MSDVRYFNFPICLLENFLKNKIDVLNDIYDYSLYNHSKTGSLLAFLAMKSILGNKAYCKTDNRYLLSRMNGSAAAHDIAALPDSLKKYANEYQLKKIKNELILNWGLKTYSRYTRGFYISFSLTHEQLITEAEKNRKGYKIKQMKLQEKALVEKVLKKLADKEKLNGHNSGHCN